MQEFGINFNERKNFKILYLFVIIFLLYFDSLNIM